MKYLVHQIGDRSSFVSSYPIKVVETLEEALAVAKEHPNTWDTEGGPGYVAIYDLVECKAVEYR